jgi:hypothetical protein
MCPAPGWFLSAVLPLVALLLPAPAPAAGPLTAEDRRFLDKLLDDFLFDPQGAERVRVKTTVRTAWANTVGVERDGWLVAGKDGEPARVHFTDGASIPAPDEKKIKKVDFVDACRQRLNKEGAAGEEDPWAGFRLMDREALGVAGESYLTLAVWLRRLGHNDLAARGLTLARKEKDPEAQLRSDLAWGAYAGVVHAYMVRADQEATTHGERLFRLYPAEAKAYPQAWAILDDLTRRKNRGTFGQAPGPLPECFGAWKTRKKIAYLIDALDEVDARQRSQPGGVDLRSDPRVRGLIRLGDAAVPALIDAVERDGRLTRSVYFGRDFGRHRTVLGVREAAQDAVMSILRVQVLEPASAGDTFTARGEETAQQTAARLRAYWKKYGGLPFDERMMKVLTDPASRGEALREAAGNLARLGEERGPGTTVLTGGDMALPRGAHPALQKFKDPTAAEAILAAMDRDLAAPDAGKRDDEDYRRRHTEDAYLFPLIELGDERVLPVLRKRCQAAPTVRLRRKWAYACHWLGDRKPLAAFAADFREGKVVLPADDRKDVSDRMPSIVELWGIIDYLASVDTPEADRALWSLTDPGHPYAARTAQRVLAGDDFRHPFCLAILRRALEDTTATGTTYKIHEDRLWHERPGGSGDELIPDVLADPATRRNEAAERVCDQVAVRLGELLLGLPPYHPLLKDADRRLAQMKEVYDRFHGTHRRLSRRELSQLWIIDWHTLFAPAVRPLGRAATEVDVEAGKAVFHLGGKGKPADVNLPAVGVLARKGNEGEETRVLVVQAEVGPDGEVTYGIIGRGLMRAVRAGELEKVTPLEPEVKDGGRQR